MENFWESNVWGFFAVFAVLLISLLAANVLKRNSKFLKASLIPTSVLAGVLIVIVACIYKAFTGRVMFDTELFASNGTAMLEMITYHTLALGFIASTFKRSGGKMTKKRTVEIFNTGVTTVSTYLLQAVFGLAITITAGVFIKGFFTASGMILPFGYGQGTGQAMNYGMMYEGEGFSGGKSFGLAIAALGFISASIGGVIHLNYLRFKGKLKVNTIVEKPLSLSQIESENEIPMQESIDKLTIQMSLIALAYFVAYLLMLGLGTLLPGMRSVIYGFNFLLGVLAATFIKSVMNFAYKKKWVKKEYTNDFLMTRVSNFFFDIMVVAGIAAIRFSTIQQYWGIILILGVVGLAVTYAYNHIVAKVLFPEYREEQFLAMYGMLTGTASTGIILLREIDGEFKSPVSDNLVYQNFPAIVFGFPLMFLASFAPKAPVLTLILVFVAFILMNVILFRKQIFRRKPKDQ